MKKGTKHTPEARAKISATLTGKKPSAETRAKISAARTGIKPSAETRAKLSAAKTGTKLSAETRAKISAAKTGMKHTPETKAKMSAARTGMKPSAETRAKMSAAKTGRKLSAETRAKISAGQKPPVRLRLPKSCVDISRAQAILERLHREFSDARRVYLNFQDVEQFSYEFMCAAIGNLKYRYSLSMIKYMIHPLNIQKDILKALNKSLRV